MVLAEVAQREAVEVPAVARIAKRAEIGVVRGDDENPAARSKQPVELFHSADDVTHVLNDVNGANFGERGIFEGKRKAVEVGDDIGVRVAVTIDPDCAGVLIDSAADVEDGQAGSGSVAGSHPEIAVRHSSSVEIAKSA